MTDDRIDKLERKIFDLDNARMAAMDRLRAKDYDKAMEILQSVEEAEEVSG